MPNDDRSRAKNRTRLLSLVGFGLALMLVGAACQPPTFEEEETILFPEREEQREEGDLETEIGQPVEDMIGWNATVKSATFRQELTPTEKEGYLVLEVTVENTSSRKRAYRRFDWKLETPSGSELNHTFVQGVEGQLANNEDLEENESASGLVIFRVREEKGTFWVYYVPRGADNERGVWKAVVG